jgi:glycosyltransferase involved in cell wall biosynthesis
MTMTLPDRTDRQLDAGAPFRVLYVLPDLQIGGGQTIVLNGVRHLDRREFDPVVSYLLEADEMAPAFTEAGCPPRRVPYARGRGLVTIAALARLMRREHIDLVHVQSDLDRQYAQLAALVTGVPVVGQLHAMWVHFGPRLPENPTRLRRARANALAFIRDTVERRTVRHYEADSVDVQNLFTPLVDVPITVTRQAVPVDAYDRAARAGARDRVRAELGIGDRPMLINVSRLVEGKGQEHLVAMLALVHPRHPDAVLVLVGDGDRRPDIERRIHQAGLDDHVHVLGNRFDIPDLLTAADLFVFGSESEGFGLVALEAMAAGKAVVAFRLPALEEFVASGDTGYLLDLRDVSGMARRVVELLDAPEKADAMGARGRAVVEQRFNPEATSESFERAYRAVLAGTTPRGARETTAKER